MPYIERDGKYYYVDEEPIKVTPTPTPQDQQLPPVAQAAPPDPRLAQELAETRRMVANLQAQLPRQQQQAPSSAEDQNRQFYKEPVAMATAIANQAANEAMRRMNEQGQAAHETLVAVARDKAREANPELFDKYRDKIEMRVKTTVDPQFQSNIQVWQAALNMVMGEHINDIRDAARQTVNAPAVKVTAGGPALPTGGQAQAPAGADSKLSDDERQMARNLDISPEQYAQGKDFYEKQAKKGPSSWDKFVTFSSKDKRRAEHAKRRAAAAK